MGNGPKNQNFSYDELGGIIEHDAAQAVCAPRPGKPHTRYSFLEKSLFSNNERVRFLYDPEIQKSGYLKKLRITPTNRCSARCFYCPRTHAQSQGSGYMDMDFYRGLVDWAADHGVPTAGFGGWGEPTLHPRLPDMIEYAIGKGLAVQLTSNFIPPDEKAIERLARYPFSTVEISMDGFNADEYRRGKCVDQYSRAFRNVTHYLECVRQGKPKTHFNVHFVDAGNVSMINKFRFVRYWKEQLRGLKHNNMYFYQPLNWGGLCNDVSSAAGPVTRLLGSYRLRKPCYLLGAFLINWDGGVNICSAHPMPYMRLGNLKEASLDELSRHPLLEKYREAHRTGNFDIPGCRDCNVNATVPFSYITKQIQYKLFSLG